MSVAARLAAHFTEVDTGWDTPCWISDYRQNNQGYCQAKFASESTTLVHRLSYQIHIGPIPVGLDLDHLCRVRSCGNPWHLEPVTRAENVRRGKLMALQDTCLRGHEMQYVNGRRRCRECTRIHQRAYRLRRAARAA